MKKISLFLAFVFASMVMFAVGQDEWIGSTDATYNNQFKWYAIDGVATPAEVVNIQQPGWSEEIGIYTHKSGFNKVTFNGVEKTNGTHYHQDGAGAVLFVSALTAKNTDVLFYNGENIVWGLRVFNVNGESSGTEKTDPALTLNVTDTTLSAATSETFQIVPSQIGDGAISYESSNAGIASVSESGLVTAVGRGKAIISVKAAETATYAFAMKKLMVNVTGPINWDAEAWLAGGNDKYKVVTCPEIDDKFGGKHIENGNLWIGFPSAVWGDNSSVQHTAVGAGVSFPLSQFPNEFNDFNFICDGVTYQITLYYVDGIPAGTAIDHVLDGKKARKVMENGQLVIIKNGVRYNALGAQVK